MSDRGDPGGVRRITSRVGSGDASSRSPGALDSRGGVEGTCSGTGENASKTVLYHQSVFATMIVA